MATKLNKIEERLQRVEQQSDVIEEITSSTFLEADKTMKNYINSAIEMVIKKVDKNKDGKISLEEWKDASLTIKIVMIVLFGMILTPSIEMLLNWYVNGTWDWFSVLSTISSIGSLFIFSFGWKSVSDTKNKETTVLKKELSNTKQELQIEKSNRLKDQQKTELDKKSMEIQHQSDLYEKDLQIQTLKSEVDLLRKYGKKLD